jgi:hypothetical protein
LTGGILSANSGVDVVFGAGRSRFGRIGDGSADVESGLGDRRGLRLSDPGTAEVRLVSTHLRGAQSVVDGGWWPRTRDRSQELPALLTAVGSRFGVVVVRVSLSATVWDATPEQISVGDRIVQVVWVWAPEARTIRLLGDRFWHVDPLVIPPDTAADARAALVAAGDGVCALRAISGVAAGSSCGR